MTVQRVAGCCSRNLVFLGALSIVVALGVLSATGYWAERQGNNGYFQAVFRDKQWGPISVAGVGSLVAVVGTGIGVGLCISAQSKAAKLREQNEQLVLDEEPSTGMRKQQATINTQRFAAKLLFLLAAFGAAYAATLISMGPHPVKYQDLWCWDVYKGVAHCANDWARGLLVAGTAALALAGVCHLGRCRS
jgi:hypothetical protein